MERRKIEDTYKKLSQLEHILLRPDSYVGSVEKEKQTHWLLETENQMVSQEIDLVPGLYKIFDEIIVNSADNYPRSKQQGVKMDEIRVNIDKQYGRITVYNNGVGIPVEIHPEHNVYVAELIFGELLTGSNYDDGEQKVVGGRNGFGAKLANVFSNHFMVEHTDYRSKKILKKEWFNNMQRSNNVVVECYKAKYDYTQITFWPDLKRFGMNELEDNIYRLFKRRVYDMCGIFDGKVKIYWNDERIKVSSFNQYVDLYIKDGSSKVQDKEINSDRWQVVIGTSAGQMQQVSFVNGIMTIRGGTHIDMIVTQITNKLTEEILKKHKKMQIKPFQIKQHLFVFVNCLIVNPTFDSQTKEKMTLNKSKFGSEWVISNKFIKELMKTGVIESIIESVKLKEEKQMMKGMKGNKKQKLTEVQKLDDANDAGGRNSLSCTLILTEGDSAKSLALSGLEVIGRDKYGVFPLKGKLLNVREATSKKIIENNEIQNIIKIIGLQRGKSYMDQNELKTLRYGGIMIMTDQDHDGSHIKGLIINFIHFFWPELIRNNQFMRQFITPILKVTKGHQTKSFFTIQDFNYWKNQMTDQQFRSWKTKYYKGLGTSTDKEAKEYFNNIDHHLIDFQYADSHDDVKIDLCFNKSKADDRKNWLDGFDQQQNVDNNKKKVRYCEFVDKEFIHFSNSDNVRSIPQLMDGLKPGQRKILYCCFKRDLKKEIKVAQLMGYVAEHSAYHHGEASLGSTIVGMAQSYVGTNNINLLMPNGQFGTRNQGGSDHASNRYIFTMLNKITRKIFREEDDHVLEYLEDDGQIVEPNWYVPIIPMVLVNGAEGIGTGWSTFIPQYDHKQICQQIKQRLTGSIDQFEELIPYYKGYTGHLIQHSKGFTSKGDYCIYQDQNRIDVIELPIRKWTNDYKKYLQEMMEGDDPDIDDLTEHHTNNRVHFKLKLNEGVLKGWNYLGFEKVLKLSKELSTNNMVLFDQNNRIKQYKETTKIMEQFYQVRYKYYQKRKDYLMSKVEREIQIVSNKVRFIMMVIDGQVIISNVKKNMIVDILISKGFIKQSQLKKVKSSKLNQKENQQEGDNDDDGDKQDKQDDQNEYDYLLRMPLWSLTYERVQSLKNEQKEKEAELEGIRDRSIENMWISDIDEFMQEMQQILKEEEDMRLKEYEKVKKKQKLKPHNYIRELEGNVELTKEQKNAWILRFNKKTNNKNGKEDPKKEDNKKQQNKKESQKNNQKPQKQKKKQTKEQDDQDDEVHLSLKDRVKQKMKSKKQKQKNDDDDSQLDQKSSKIGTRKQNKKSKLVIEDTDISDFSLMDFVDEDD